MCGEDGRAAGVRLGAQLRRRPYRADGMHRAAGVPGRSERIPDDEGVGRVVFGERSRGLPPIPGHGGMRVALEPAGASHVAVAEEYSMWQSQRRHQGNRDRTPVGEVQARG